MLSRRLVLGAALGAVASTPARAAPVPLLKGVNVAGLEFNPRRLPGRARRDYAPADARELAYYRAAGTSVIRLPFLWERLQPELGGGFDAGYFALITQAVADARPMRVILDAHQYGRRRVDGRGVIIGETPLVTSAHFAAFWSELARRFRDEPRIVFGLQNEPHDQDSNTLVSVQNAAITAIRRAGARQLILVCGNAWSGAHSWANGSNGRTMLRIHDPAGNFAFDVHQYLDRRSSGVGAACVEDAGRRLDSFTRWARTNRRRGFLGEFGGGANARCLAEMRQLLQHIERNRDVWLGWTAWGGGAWWPASYPLRLRPDSMSDPVDRPQMAELRRFLR